MGFKTGPSVLHNAIAEIYISTNAGDSSAAGYYVADDFCIHEGKLYKCKGTTYGTFDPTKWDETTVAENFGTGDDFTGATAQQAGAHGMVPAPSAGDQTKFLKGDGSWGTVPNPQNMGGATAQAAGTAGLAPAPAAGDQGKFLKGDGTWGNVPNPQDMSGATSSAAGAHGLVPAPAAGDEDKFLKGDGTWFMPDVSIAPEVITLYQNLGLIDTE